MHHFGEDSTEVKSHPDHYDLIFTNKTTQTKITMNVPRQGVFDDAQKSLDEAKARALADEIAHMLRSFLN